MLTMMNLQLRRNSRYSGRLINDALARQEPRRLVSASELAQVVSTDTDLARAVILLTRADERRRLLDMIEAIHRTTLGAAVLR
jgi:hypothetical protein